MVAGSGRLWRRRGAVGARPSPARPGAALAVLLLLVPVAACAGARPPVVGFWPGGPVRSWQWQLTGPLDLTVEAEVFALDAFSTTVDDVRRLRQRGRRTLCHVRVGTYEPGRPDAARYPAATLGRPAGGAGRRWLDVRQWWALEPILADRFRLCRGKGFQAVFPDDMDGYAQQSGFPLTFDDQLVFNRRIAALVRRSGLSPGLTSDLDQVLALERDFDFVVNEECFRRGGCERLLPFVAVGKQVFQVEYVEAATDGPTPLPTARIGGEGPPADVCTAALGYGFASIRKRRALDAWHQPCRL